MRTLFDHPLYKSFAYFLVAALSNLLAPNLLVALMPTNLRLPAALRILEADAGKKAAQSRPLTMTEMKKDYGKDNLNPYLAGTSKWDISYKGVDLFTGNYSLSVTDLDFQGGFGIPVSVQRSYSSNQANEGPFGCGWTLSADVRSTAGGVLKSSKAPVMAVPATFKEVPVGQADPRLSSPPANAVVATDPSNNPETIQKDVDGILTTPPWDNNVSNPTYVYETFGGSTYQVQSGNQTTTPDGTVYTYAAEGSYPSGMTPVNNPGGTPVPSNVLKVTTVVDRQGNTTTYNYATGTGNQATFLTSNGTTVENELSSVSMPNGHTLTFTWNQNVNGTGKQRITSVSDGTRTVSYAYDYYGDLWQVTSPGGKTTSYGYNEVQNNDMPSGSTVPAINMLVSITDPRGLQTQIVYELDTTMLEPYGFQVEGALVKDIIAPSGNYTSFWYNGMQGYVPPDGPTLAAYEWVGAPQTNWQNCYQVVTALGATVESGYQTTESVLAPLSPGQQYVQMTDPQDNYPGYDLLAGSSVIKTFDPFMQTCLTTESITSRTPQGQWSGDKMTSFNDYAVTLQNDWYNFMSNPLIETSEQYRSSDGEGVNKLSNYPDTSQEKEYAYWGPAKYFQQKAEVDRFGTSEQRISYTDYYPSTGSAGTRGQTYKTYSDPYAVWQTGTLPQNDSSWQTDLAPNTSSYDSYASLADYDSYGRATDVYKLQTVSGSTFNYVHMNTVYGANNSTWWGEPETVTEDVGGIARVTQTLAYDSSGHATRTEDAAGHICQTNYLNADYQVSNIVETDCEPNVTLVSYTYGSGQGTPSSITDNGQVLSVTDGLSGIADNITYDHTVADGGFGQPSQSSESWPWDTGGSQHGYSVSYAYTLAGDRSTSTYLTDNGSTTWQYDNYGPAGQPQKGGPPSRVPQTMRLLSSGSPTAEEFHYLYDGAGALQATSFAMTPETGFTPTGSNPWYDPTDLASTRARAVYDNAGSGQNLNLNYYWDTWNSEGSNYGSSGIYGYSYSYDPVSMLKTGAVLNDFNAHEEAYGYAPALDYLNSANYNSGDGGTTETWSYDAAGNRLSDSSNPGTWSYDNLNRMTASPGLTYSNDILGNRLSNSATSNGWDQLCRMTSFTSGSTTTNYTYRSDGMRALKAVASGNSTSFAYDGQMGFEDVDAGASPAVTDYAIGARGIDRLAKTSGGTTSVGYPIYDGHGNMVSTLSESGSSYSTGNGRQYDAWGNILNSDGSGDPKGRYCANLGHKQDDESGLIYMRARYCDAKVGRFASQDSAHAGRNWFVYCSSNPVSYGDTNGRSSFPIDSLELIVSGLLIVLGKALQESADSDFALVSIGDLVINASTVCLGLAVVAFVAGAYLVVADLLEAFLSNVSVMGLDHGLDATLAMIDSFKESQNISEEIGASMAEDMVWLAVDMYGDD